MEIITDTLIVRQDFPVSKGESWRVVDHRGKLVEEWFILSEPKVYGKTRKQCQVRKEILVAQD